MQIVMFFRIIETTKRNKLKNIIGLNPKSSVKLIIYFFILFATLAHSNINAQTDNKIDELYKEAQAQYSELNYNKTIEICNQILAVKSDLVGVQLLLSYVYDETGDTELELQYLNEALKLNDHPYIKWRLGELYYKLSNYSEALNFYNIYKDYKYISEKTRLTLACKMASCIFNIQSLKKYGYSGVLVETNQLENYTDSYWPTPLANGTKLIFLQESDNSNPVSQDVNFISAPDSLNEEFTEQFADSINLSAAGDINLSKNHEVIFFTGNNRDDGFGDDDIYFSRFTNGTWSSPVNAGNLINTVNSESHFLKY